MATIGIVSCRIFEDELTFLMRKESEKKRRLLLIETDFSEKIEQKFDLEGIVYEKIESEKLKNKLDEQTDAEDTIIIQLIEFSMEAHPDKIKDVVYDKVQELQESVNGILVFYGLCGNVLGNIDNDLSTPDCPVRILRDEDGDIADDCICVSIGSRKKYVQIIRTDGKDGTYFLTPMQAAHWREIAYASALTPDPNDDEMLKMVFEYSNYKNVGKVATGLQYEKDFDHVVDDFSKRFNLKIINYEGNPSIIENSFNKFLRLLKEK